MSDADDRPSGGRSADDTDTGDREVVVEQLPAEEAFELLTHETRFRILENLNEADGALAFSELRKRVGVRDACQFNYHLGKLTDRFVRDTEGGYELGAPGRRVVGAVLSGGYTKALDADPVEMDSPCLLCGSPMDVEFRDDGVNIECRECAFTLTDASVPAGILEGVTPEEVPSVVGRWFKRNHAGADFGFCYNCDGRLDQTVRIESADAEEIPDSIAEYAPFASVFYECERCGFSWYSSFPFGIILHPAIAGFHYEHGVDVRETPTWDLDWIEPGTSTIQSRDPIRVEVSVTLDDETRVFTFDGDANLIEQRRA